MTAITSSGPRRSNGCLWGCLAVVIIIALPFAAASLYAGWFFYEGWRHNAVLRAATDLVTSDGMARLALGGGIHVTGVDGSGYATVLGLGTRTDYKVALEGAKGDGTLDVIADSVGGHVAFESMILTGPDGTRYDLLHHTAAPAPGPSSDSI